MYISGCSGFCHQLLTFFKVGRGHTVYYYTKISRGESNLISCTYENPRKKLMLNKTKSLLKLNDNVFI